MEKKNKTRVHKLDFNPIWNRADNMFITSIINVRMAYVAHDNGQNNVGIPMYLLFYSFIKEGKRSYPFVCDDAN